MADRIDVHQHVLPPIWVEGLRERNLPHRPPPWSPDAALAFMDASGVATGLLSLTAPGLAGWAEDELAPMTRRVNEYVAGLVAARPDRFGNLAYLPLPDLESAVAEACFALDTLGADGVTLLSNYGDRYLGDPWLEPLWAELDRRAAVVLVHPTRLTQPELKGIPGPIVDFPFGTTRAAVQMVTNGVLDRHPNVRVILSHGGGFLPYAAHRFAALAAAGRPGSPRSETFEADTQTILANFRRFYLDTALASSPCSIPSLQAFADPARLLYGSDFPYAPGGVGGQFTAMLDTSPLLSVADHSSDRPTQCRSAISEAAALAASPICRGGGADSCYSGTNTSAILPSSRIAV